MGRKRPAEPVRPDAWKREKVLPSDSLDRVIAKAREEASWFPEEGKTWALLLRLADELEQRL